jgi:transcriptional regulator with XRE-family HTH domain
MPPDSIIIVEVKDMYFKRIGDLRQDNDLTQQEVADLLHCRREVYRRYEKGEREIPISFAITLAERYDVTVDYLLGISDKKK